jgi:hypothetical protein
MGHRREALDVTLNFAHLNPGRARRVTAISGLTLTKESRLAITLVNARQSILPVSFSLLALTVCLR